MNCPFCIHQLRFTQDESRPERVWANCNECYASGPLEAPYDNSGAVTEHRFTGVISQTRQERITFIGHAPTWTQQQEEEE